MIKYESYNVILSFNEIAAVEAYQLKGKIKSFCTLISGASFMASCDGVTVSCVTEKQAQELWDTVLCAMPEEDEE